MKKLIEVVQEAGRNCVAIGHFNIADLVLLKGVFQAAHELNVPVMVGASEGEREFAGTRQLAALVRSLREEFDYPIFLNADHSRSFLHSNRLWGLPIPKYTLRIILGLRHWRL